MRARRMHSDHPASRAAACMAMAMGGGGWGLGGGSVGGGREATRLHTYSCRAHVPYVRA